MSKHPEGAKSAPDPHAELMEAVRDAILCGAMIGWEEAGAASKWAAAERAADLIEDGEKRTDAALTRVLAAVTAIEERARGEEQKLWLARLAWLDASLPPLALHRWGGDAREIAAGVDADVQRSGGVPTRRLSEYGFQRPSDERSPDA